MMRSVLIVGVGAFALLSAVVAISRADVVSGQIAIASIVISIGLHGVWSCVVSYVVGSEFDREEQQPWV